MKKKVFDCVQMKGDIQRKLAKEERGLSLEERNRRAETKILADPILGPWWRKVKRHSPAPAAVAESPGVYLATPAKRKGRA